MENKFTKGILERQEREYKKQKTTVPQNIQPTMSSFDNTRATEKPQTKNKKQTMLQEKQQLPAMDLPDGLEAYIVRENRRKAKNKTFYLDETVIQAIQKSASTQHITESKLVNDILKKILIP